VAHLESQPPREESVLQQTLKVDSILAELQKLLSKLKLQSPDFVDLDCRVLAIPSTASPYVIDISKGRMIRRVIVDPRTAEHFHLGHLDPNLLREIRSAMLAVARRARNRG
jgi:hypothetical protein